MCSDGLSKGARRQSQHSLEAEKMGLRKSQEGIYEDVTKSAAGASHKEG